MFLLSAGISRGCGADCGGGLDTREGSGSLDADKRAFIFLRTVGLVVRGASSSGDVDTSPSSSSYIPGIFGARDRRVV